MKRPLSGACWIAVLLVTLALLGSGCVITSVYPFYFEKDAYLDPSLLGEWKVNESPTERWRFERFNETSHSYRLTFTDSAGNRESEKRPMVLIATLFRIKEEIYLDLFSTDRDEAVIPPHLIQKVKVTPQGWSLRGLNEKWLRDTLGKNPRFVRHLVEADPGSKAPSDRILLTADTSELQRFLKRVQRIDAAWDSPTSLQRLAPPPR